MESRTYIRNIKVTPKKLRALLPAIKRLTPGQAMERLFYTSKKGAKVFYKAIQSAMSNARSTLKVADDELKFKTLLVEEGQRLKRFRAGGRGMARPYVRRFAHIKIVLEAKEKSKIEVGTLNKSKKTKIKSSKSKKA